jgi:hypothetical protein
MLPGIFASQVYFCGPWTDGVVAGLSKHSWFDQKREDGCIFPNYLDALDYLMTAETPTPARKQSIMKHRQSVSYIHRDIAERRDTSL